MSTEKTDTTSSVDDAVESHEATASGKDTHNGETTEVSKADLEDLTGLLRSYKTVILAHEERLLDHEGRITTLERKKPVKLEIPRGRSR